MSCCLVESSNIYIYNMYNITYNIYLNILLGAPTIGRGSAQPRGGGGGSQKSQIRLQSCPEYTKAVQKRPFSRTY
jgi:hypothetical protein